MCASARSYTEKSDAVVAARAAESRGVLSRVELLACGLDDDAIAWRVANGRLHRVHRGVYAVGHDGLTAEGRWLAAVKACGAGAVLSHSSSLMLFGLLHVDERRPDVTVTSTRAPQGIRVHRTRHLDPYDIWRHHGIPTTSPARAIFDVAPTMPDRAVRGLMSRAQAKNLANLRTLAQQLDRSRGRASARYARVLAGTPPRTRSELEDRVHDLIDAGGFQRPDVNRALILDGRRVVPDFRWPQQRLCVEADSRRWHDNPQQREEDAHRQALLEAHGERLVRITWEQATAHVAQSHARLHHAGAPRPRARP